VRGLIDRHDLVATLDRAVESRPTPDTVAERSRAHHREKHRVLAAANIEGCSSPAQRSQQATAPFPF
jgi:hypothetical protein